MGLVALAEDAKSDLDQIVDWIASDNPVVAADWLSKVRELFDLLAIHPELGESVATGDLALSVVRSTAPILSITVHGSREY